MDHSKAKAQPSKKSKLAQKRKEKKLGPNSWTKAHKNMTGPNNSSPRPIPPISIGAKCEFSGTKYPAANLYFHAVLSP